MREIKFTAKKIETNKWVYGSYAEALWEMEHKKQSIIVEEDCEFNGWAISEGGKSVTMVDSETVGQFTGLYDKNGKEIYEGDIVVIKRNDKILTVGDIQFHCGVFGAEWRHVKKDKTLLGGFGQNHNLRRLDDDIIDDIEVIGNIHDTPELIKE